MRKVIKKEQVRVDDTRPALPMRDVPAAGGDVNQPAVRVLRHEGRVVAIECTCSCGERTTVEFEYGSLDAQPPTQTPVAPEPALTGEPAPETPEAR